MHSPPHHEHLAHFVSERAFFEAVSRNENRAAHGGVCIVETCSCGATRMTNRNGRHQEVGAWKLGKDVRHG